jgi:DNA mismatch repair protein MutL
MHWRPSGGAQYGLPNVDAAAAIDVVNELPLPARATDVDTLFEPTDANVAGAVAPPAAERIADLEIVQLRRTYLVYEHDDGVVVVDQHSAHERILYEKLLAAFEGGSLTSQRLLFPVTLHLGGEEQEALEEHRASLEKVGFEIEDFGGQSVVVHSVPVLHTRFDALRCLRETLASLTGDRGAAVHGRHERLIATLACRAAIKAGDALQPGERRALLADLARTDLSAHDVHGRSAIVRLSWIELERRFGRR